MSFNESDDTRIEEANLLSWKNPLAKLFSFTPRNEDAEVTAICKQNAELLQALETGYKFGVRYTDYEGSATVYFKYRLSAENFVKCGVFTAEPEMFEL